MQPVRAQRTRVRIGVRIGVRTGVRIGVRSGPYQLGEGFVEVLL